MSKPVNVIVLAEGLTEHIFIKDLLAPEFGKKMVFLYPATIGGDVRFERVQHDIGAFLKQRPDAYVTTFIDYYGVKEWPGVDDVPQSATPAQIAQIVYEATRKQINALFSPNLRTDKRFIPYMTIHEFEALLFSDSVTLADELNQNQENIDAILTECVEPEAINKGPQTAPSKRLDRLSGGKFPKTTLGIGIARAIGIPKMREKCPLFNSWLEQLEALAHDDG